MILLVSRNESLHANLVESALKKINGNYFRLNVDRILLDYNITWFEDGSGKIEDKSGRKIKIEQIKSVWWYDFPTPSIKGLNIDSRYKDWAKYETANGLFWILSNIEAYFMSRPENIEYAHAKSVQKKYAQEVGLKVPKTIISNNPIEIGSFVKTNSKNVFKTIAPVSREKDKKTREILTSLVSHVDLNSDSIKIKLNLFQEYIEKEYELRIIVVANICFAVKIESQATDQTKVDWRRYDIPNTPHWSYSLPFGIQKKCITLTKKLGLEYAAIDMIKDPNGEYFFLEVNPVGLWAWLEMLTDSKISNAIAKRLVEMDEML